MILDNKKGYKSLRRVVLLFKNNIMSDEKVTKKEKKVEVKVALKPFYFPTLRRTVMAKSLEEAKELLAESIKPSSEDK